MERTSGDVIRINITPPADTFPWIRFFVHDYGIKHSGHDVGGVDGKRDKTREELAQELGEMLISSSRVLSAWFEGR